MMKKKNNGIVIGISIFLTLLFSLSGFSQTIRINEFMALNQTTLTDEDGEYSDWLELYNNSGTSVDLQGWALTDDASDLSKWIFPDITLEADAYLLVFASGKDRRTAGNELHTSFKLSGSGEYLALINAAGVTVSDFSPAFPPQQTDYSYGYYEGAWIEFSDPTPGEDNSLSVGTVIPPPSFNVKHGFFESSFALSMQSSVPGATIYFTRDGSAPTPEHGTLYSGPITILTTSVVRAIAVVEGEPESNITTQTYIFPEDVIHQSNTPSGYPATWGPYTAIPGDAIADYEMDPELMADDTFAEAVKSALLDIPTISLVTDKGYLFSHSTDPDTGGIYIYTGAPLTNTTYDVGRGWERPVSFEFFDKDSASLQVNCGVSLQGGHSRRPEKSPKHSFLLEFKSEYGPTRLKNYSFFGEDGSGDYNKLILRSGFGNSWIHHSHDERQRAQYERDIWTKDTQRDMGHPSSNSIYVHLYINGIYWGIYAPSERMDSDFGAKYLGGEPEDYDVIKDYAEVADGTIDAWNMMMDMANAGLVTNEAYQRIQGKLSDGTPDPGNNALVDVVNLADYMLVNFYGGNTDWDHHNWAAMRNRIDPGKGFKFFCWDAEHMVKDVYTNVVNENNANCPSRVYSQLKQNEDFRRLFADRVQKHCFNGGALTPEATVARWINRQDQVETSIRVESARWGDYRRDVHQYQTAGPFYLYTYEDFYLPQQDFMLNTYFPSRTDVFLEQLRADNMFPDVDAPVFYLNDAPVFSEIIDEGDILSMTTTQGTIYYTTDGTDPVNWYSEEGSSEVTLIAEVDEKRVTVPKSDVGNNWYSNISYDESEWQICSGAPGGVGYEKNSGYENLISLDVGDDMHDDGSNPNTSCYIRITFNVEEADLDDFTSLMLSVDYDDGFVAYLNGSRVAEANAPAEVLWNSVAENTHEAGTPEYFNLSDHLDLLSSGENLLAIHGLNRATSSSDFLINASLLASDSPLGGNLSENADVYSSPISLEQSSHVIARAFHNGDWSAASDKFFIIPEDYLDLKITEINYNPLGEDTVDGGQFEFVEIKNTGTSTLDLGGLEFSAGINYEFPPETQLGPDGFAVLASNKTFFASRYGFLPMDEYDGKLDNDGERLVLLDFFKDTIIDIMYNDNEDWPQQPDGEGNSLVPVDLNPVNDQNIPSEWRASWYAGGSPGEDDLLLPVTPFTQEVPEVEFSLAQNYPNPFSDITYIDYRISEEANIQLTVYNIMGQMITTLVSAREAEGQHQVAWDGRNQSGNLVPNGLYIYRLTVQSRSRTEVLTQKMMFLH